MTDGVVAHAPSHRHVLSGGCLCRRVTLAFETVHAAGALQPRACDCAFCRMHDAAWLSDAEGALRIEARGAAPRRERQGDERADFLRCADCGALLAVVFDTDDGTFGAVNARCLDADRAGEFGEAIIVSPRRLSAGEKTARWRQLWTPDVRIAILPAAPLDTPAPASP